MGDRYEVRNPATEDILVSLELQDGGIVADAVCRARKAFASWRRVPLERRRSLLVRAAASLRKDAESLSASLTREQGKPLKESKSEVVKAAELIDYYAGMLDVPDRRESRNEDGLTSRVVREPRGVAAAVVPNNYPVALLAYKMVPALLAGCTVVVKPDLQTAPTTELILDRFRAAGLPRDVLLSIHCDDATADDHLLGPRGADIVSFTGSCAGGREVLSRAAEHGPKALVLELGGVNSLVVEPDAPIEDSLRGALYKAFRNAGQVCHGVSSVFVHRDIHDRWLRRFSDAVGRIRVGDGAEPGVEMGPLTTASRLDAVSRLVEEAQATGATIHRGGYALPEKGWFYPPTVVSGVGPDAPVASREIFGPAVVVEPYSVLEDVIDSINGRETGLVSYLYSGDETKLETFASEVECGTVGLNTVRITAHDAPFGGWKQSGLGYELGREGLENFRKLKHLRCDVGVAQSSPSILPDARKAKNVKQDDDATGRPLVP